MPAAIAATPFSASPRLAPSSTLPSGIISAPGSLHRTSPKSPIFRKSSATAALPPDRHDFCPSYRLARPKNPPKSRHGNAGGNILQISRCSRRCAVSEQVPESDAISPLLRNPSRADRACGYRLALRLSRAAAHVGIDIVLGRSRRPFAVELLVCMAIASVLTRQRACPQRLCGRGNKLYVLLTLVMKI